MPEGHAIDSCFAEDEAGKLIKQVMEETLMRLEAIDMLDRMTWSWNSRLGKTKFGRALLNECHIQLNPRILEHFAQIESTLQHEICHLVAFERDGERGHGWPWAKLMNELGLPSNPTSPDRYGTLRTHPPHWMRGS